MSEIRLNKFLAQSGAVSRRKADELIAQGFVSINGKTITTLGTKIDPEKDTVTLRDHKMKPQKEFIYLALNKPKNYITTLDDEFNRPTIKDLIPPALKDKGLKPIGRLDKDTEGLLVLTNDLELINQLTHPRYEKEKEYNVTAEGVLTPEQKVELERGIFLPEENGETAKRTLPCKIMITKTTKQTTEFKMTLKEGRKRQIRKMLKQMGLPVLYLQRIRVGNLRLGSHPIQNLKPGQTKLIDKKCLQA